MGGFLFVSRVFLTGVFVLLFPGGLNVFFVFPGFRKGLNCYCS